MLDNNPLTGLIEPPDRRDSWRWGTVVSGSPVRVRLDGDSEPSLATPDALVPVLTGDRVRVHVHNRRMTIVGRMGGPAQNTIFINGSAYQATGSIVAPDYSWAGTSNGISYGTISVPVPYQRPSGWSFQWSVGHSNRTTFVANASRYPDSNGIQQVRIIQIGNSDLGQLTRLNWQLVKI